jgi:hypothetical protein
MGSAHYCFYGIFAMDDFCCKRASFLNIAGVIMGPDTEERIKAMRKEDVDLAAQAAAQAIYDKLYPVLVKRDKTLWRGIWNAIKHGGGIVRKEIDEVMKD